MNTSVKAIWVTPNAEERLMKIARVSSNTPNSSNPKLISYLIKHGHWSPFEMVNMCLEIVASRAVTRQILRHRSFSFQEFSQRYQQVDLQKIILPQLRFQDPNNRQNSIEPKEDDPVIKNYRVLLERFVIFLDTTYKAGLQTGIAKECVRCILPEGLTPSKIYVNGTVRSWIHYLQSRLDESTQKEHREIAYQVQIIFIQRFPETSKALGWLVDLKKKK